MHSQLIFDTLANGETGRFLGLWWIPIVLAVIFFHLTFAIWWRGKHPQSTSALYVQRVEQGRLLGALMVRHPALPACLGLLMLFASGQSLWVARGKAARLASQDFSTVSGAVTTYSVVSRGSGRSPIERDTLSVQDRFFDVSCEQPPNVGHVGAPGTCLPLHLGSIVRVAYVQLAGNRYLRKPLRIWVLWSDPV